MMALPLETLELPGVTDTPDPRAVIRALPQVSVGVAFTLVDVESLHRFLGATEIIQALVRQIHRGKSSRCFVVVLAPVVQIPPELEKLFTVIDHDLPTHSQLERIAREVAIEPGQLPTPEYLPSVVEAAAGLTRSRRVVCLRSGLRPSLRHITLTLVPQLSHEHWYRNRGGVTSPIDLTLDEARELLMESPPLGQGHRGRHIGLADGRVGFLGTPLTRSTADALLTCHGGESVDLRGIEIVAPRKPYQSNGWAILLFLLLSLVPAVRLGARDEERASG